MRVHGYYNGYDEFLQYYDKSFTNIIRFQRDICVKIHFPLAFFHFQC